MPVDPIDFEDLPPYTVSCTQAGPSVTRTVMTSWLAVETFEEFMLGNVKDTNEDGLERTVPQPHPVKHFLYASEVVLVRGEGAMTKSDGQLTTEGMPHHFDNQPDNPGKTGGKAVWSVTYRPRPYVITEAVGSEFDRWVAFQADVSLEALALPGNSFKWEKAPQASIPEGIAIQRTMEALTYTWVWVPDFRIHNLRTKTFPRVCGRVNRVQFDDFAPGTVLCLAPQISPLSWTPTGAPVRDVAFQFLRRSDGRTWNQFFRRIGDDGGEFQDIVSRAAGKPPPYDSADFYDLWRKPA